MSEQSKNARTLVGRVVSDRMDKTITVAVERRVQHPVYGKYIRRSTKLHAHDEENAAKRGDFVRIRECRPLSRTKAWRLVEVVESAVGA
ncbi:MAG TPA: 30S ribosomal protein S17 [Gammaproteobacteria bacterium]|nr:30S ribosomal protein S17 [Gammaproteobacteria bacterium]